MSKLVRYIFEEHKVITIAKSLKNVDPRYIIVNSFEDATFTLRLALDNNDTNLFFYLWNQEFNNVLGESFSPLFTEEQLRVIIEFALYKDLS